MKAAFHSSTLQDQRYTCHCCGRGCRTFLVPVQDDERKAIEALAPWREQLDVEALFVKSSAAGLSGYGLAKHDDGRCVFLDEENLCAIHKDHGLEAKPLACQLFPFVLTPFNGQLRIGLRFDCPGVCMADGAELKIHLKEIKRLAEAIVPVNALKVPPPPIIGKHSVSAEAFDVINDQLIKIIDSNLIPLTIRLRWLNMFKDHLKLIKWNQVDENDIPDLLNMFRTGLLAEIQNASTERIEITGKPRKMLGQYFFILSHPSTIITNSKDGYFKTIADRLGKLSSMKKLSKTTGPLPKIQPDWPDCDLSELEQPLGDIPDEVDELISRYLLCRLGGLNYCGPNFYNYSMIDGIESLLIAAITWCWLMRIEAIKTDEDEITFDHAMNALMPLDGNFGYGSALNTGPAKMRLTYLTNHLDGFIRWYCQ